MFVENKSKVKCSCYVILTEWRGGATTEEAPNNVSHVAHIIARPFALLRVRMKSLWLCEASHS